LHFLVTEQDKWRKNQTHQHEVLLHKGKIKNGLVDVQCVRTSENHADVFTKNMGGEKFNYHMENIMKGVV
jgi:hypothetical protein